MAATSSGVIPEMRPTTPATKSDVDPIQKNSAAPRHLPKVILEIFPIFTTSSPDLGKHT